MHYAKIRFDREVQAKLDEKAKETLEAGEKKEAEYEKQLEKAS